jgi:hypothetical protein
MAPPVLDLLPPFNTSDWQEEGYPGVSDGEPWAAGSGISQQNRLQATAGTVFVVIKASEAAHENAHKDDNFLSR